MNERNVRAGLASWAATEVGSAATVCGLRALAGHAGLSFAFDLEQHGQVEPLVLRLAPPGVKRRANNDVLRQVPLLIALADAGVPVASVRGHGNGPDPFGTDYLIVDFLPGVGRPTDGWTAGAAPGLVQYEDAARVLATMHVTVEHALLEPVLETRSVRTEIEAWDRAMTRSEPQLQHSLSDVRHQLLASVPDPSDIGLVHGDYQFSNLLFVDDRVTAVLDWELAGIGPQLLDLGWLLAITDDRNWTHDLPVRPHKADAQMIETYAATSGRSVHLSEVAYFEALACWRFAIIAGVNLSLHRSGRRIDAHWERIAPSVRGLLRRATELLNSGA